MHKQEHESRRKGRRAERVEEREPQAGSMASGEPTTGVDLEIKSLKLSEQSYSDAPITLISHRYVFHKKNPQG